MYNCRSQFKRCSRSLPLDEDFVESGCYQGQEKREWTPLHVYLFRRQHQIVAVAWCAPGQAHNVVLAPSVAAYDIMGNPLSACPLVLTDSPVYVVGETISSLGSIAVSFER